VGSVINRNDAVLARVNGKNYYVRYSDLTNHANNEFPAYEDQQLNNIATINGKTLMIDKSEIENQLKKDIKMPSKSHLAAKTENVLEKKMSKSLKKEYVNPHPRNSIGLNSLEQNKVFSYNKYFRAQNPTQKNVVQVGRTGKISVQVNPDVAYVISKSENPTLFFAYGFDTSIKDVKFIRDEKLDTTDTNLDRLIRRILGIEEPEMVKIDKVRDYIHEQINKYISEYADDSSATDDEMLDYINSHREATGHSLFEKGKISRQEMEKQIKLIDKNSPYGNDPWHGEIDEINQKLHQYIREQVIKNLREQYSKVNPEYFPYGDIESAGGGLREEDQPSAEELEAKKKAAEEKKKKDAYRRFFSQALAKFGVSSVHSIPDEKKKEFFDYIDANWTSKQEEAGKKKITSEHVERITVDGKVYDAKVFYDDESANAFIEKFPGWGVIKVLGQKGNINYRVYVAKNDVPGREIELDETSSTGGVAGYMTPVAFSGKKGISKKQKEISNQLGYHLVDQNEDLGGDPEDLKKKQESLNEEIFKPGDIVKVSGGSGVASDKTAVVVNRKEIKTGNRGVPSNVEGAYKPVDWNKEVAIRYIKDRSGNPITEPIYDTMFKNRLIKVKSELQEEIKTEYFKDSELTSEQKLGLAMRQVRNTLQEVENLVQKTVKMKNEQSVDSTKVGKRTYGALKRINEKVVKLMVALQELK